MKLVECLASGRPVVTTTTGDIPAYLSNRESAYLSEPCNHDEFARLVIEALRNPQEAERVGAAGRAVAERVFAAHRVARLVSDFAASLPSTRRIWPGRISRQLR